MKHSLAGFTGEKTSLFISSALWPKYLVKSLLQRRTSEVTPSPRLKYLQFVKYDILKKPVRSHSEVTGRF